MQRLIARPSDRLRPAGTNAVRDSSPRPKPGWRWASLFAYKRLVLVLSVLSVILMSRPHLGLENLQFISGRIGQGIVSGTVRFGFVVDNISVIGNTNVTRQALVQALSINPGTPLLFVDLLAATARVEALDWVRAAELRRQLPDQLLLRIYERRPVALWQRGGTFTLVDDQGHPFTETPVQLFGHLPVLVGSAAPKAYSQLSSMLPSLTGFQEQLSAAIWVGERRWNLKFAGGLTIFLPETDVEAAWRLFLGQIETSDLLAHDLVTVDLRQSGRLIVGVHPDAVWERGGTYPGRKLEGGAIPEQVGPNGRSPSKLAIGEHGA